MRPSVSTELLHRDDAEVSALQARAKGRAEVGASWPCFLLILGLLKDLGGNKSSL